MRGSGVAVGTGVAVGRLNSARISSGRVSGVGLGVGVGSPGTRRRQDQDRQHSDE